MLAVLPMLLMFIVTSVVMLRERTSGTLERILTTPLRRWNLVASYGIVFGILALLQATILAALIVGPLGVEIEESWLMLLLVAVLDALFGVAFGLLASAFARTEFQAVQFMPLFVAPQVFLCGLLVPIENMPRILEVIAQWLPMTWAVDVVHNLMTSASLDGGSWWRLTGLAAAVTTALFVASRSMRRQS
ncbi:ABC transporter permease [Corynebacterium parakroppenstedtii]|uniref:ABC transporter permease n=1 Tax=Corynebacterium parakroppenstedtii TaxID=2828363 RepID=UPI0021AEBC7B|nr:ABC transporter permease [Corynebacterium parakroppenstedtii]